MQTLSLTQCFFSLVVVYDVAIPSFTAVFCLCDKFSKGLYLFLQYISKASEAKVSLPLPPNKNAVPQGSIVHKN